MIATAQARGRVEWWLYAVSHGQLLFRRNKTQDEPRRFEILFKDVAAVQLAMFYDNLRVVELETGDAELALVPAGDRRCFKLFGDNAVGYVIASSVLIAEDDLEYDAPSSLLA